MIKTTACAAVLATFAVGAVADATIVTEKDYQLPKCDKPVASVVVGRIVCKSSNCQATQETAATNPVAALIQLQAGQSQMRFPGIGDGMSAMLTTVLKETGCFDIQEREAIDDVARELALVGKKVEVQQADFMISGAITSINMSTEKTQLGGGLIPVLGAFSRTTQTADIGMDMKIIDVNHAKIVQSRTFVANNETSSTSFGGGAFVGFGLVGGAFSNIKGTPMEPIVRDVLARVASFASTKLVASRVADPGAILAMPPPAQESAVR